MLRRLILTAALMLCQPALAEEVVAGLSQDRVSITTNFDGSQILIYGAVKREAPIPEGPLSVIITVSAPAAPVTVRRKERRLGIWVNVDAIEVDAAPSFYAVASSGPLDDVLSQTEDQRHKVSVERAIRSVGAPDTIPDAEAFTEALIRIRSNNGLFQTVSDPILVTEDTLFSTTIDLPANLVEGAYATRIFLTRDKSVVDVHETTIDVRKVGLERWIYNLAHQQPLIYGLLSLFIAIAAGWLASAVFRYIRT